MKLPASTTPVSSPSGYAKPAGPRPPRRFSPAFNLLEVLFAIGIFAVGFVAVASLFPAAALLQKYAADDLNAQQLGVNIQAALQSRNFTLTSSPTQPYDLSLLPEPKTTWSDSRNDFIRPLTTNQFITPGPNCWTISDRSVPSNITPINNRKYIWVPLAKCSRDIPPIASSASDWTFYIFILQRDQGKSYPRFDLGANNPGWANFFQGTTGILNDGWVDNNTTPNNNADLSTTDTYFAPGIRSITVTAPVSAGQTAFTITNDDGAGNLLIRTGDLFLDSNGVSYTATLATTTTITVASEIPITPAAPNRLWFSQRANPDDPCPTLRIITVNDAVE